MEQRINAAVYVKLAKVNPWILHWAVALVMKWENARSIKISILVGIEYTTPDWGNEARREQVVRDNKVIIAAICCVNVKVINECCAPRSTIFTYALYIRYKHIHISVLFTTLPQSATMITHVRIAPVLSRCCSGWTIRISDTFVGGYLNTVMAKLASFPADYIFIFTRNKINNRHHFTSGKKNA